jgi:TetR/AcrR family transcriptional regulator
MKQEEKTRRTVDRILHAAILEFGAHNYETASLNRICKEHNVSKGLLYHNFKNKDELYLRCVEISFEKLTEYLKRAEYSATDVQKNLHTLLTMRQNFFHENPYLSKIFFQAVLQPPRHLASEIRRIRWNFDSFHAERYREVIHSIALRPGVTEEMALQCFCIFQEMFNRHFRDLADSDTDFSTLVEAHEVQLPILLNILLYGICADRPDNLEEISPCRIPTAVVSLFTTPGAAASTQ